MKKVFIVEDSKELEEWLTGELNRSQGIKVVGKSDTYMGAVKGIENTKANIAIIDINLSEGNGIDVLKKIKSVNPEIKTIMFTNYPMFRKQCMEMGADYFLDKSFDYDKIISLIDDL